MKNFFDKENVSILHPRHNLYKWSSPSKTPCMENEIWKDVPGYDGFYQVSTLGRFKSKNGFLSLLHNRDGYYRVTLCINGTHKKPIAHKIVWDTFNEIKSDKHRLVVDHIDNNRLNNRLSNLQLLTNRENVSKSCLRKKKTSQYTGVSFDKRTGKWVAQYKIRNKSFKVGSFLTEHEAHIAYQGAINKLETSNPVLCQNQK